MRIPNKFNGYSRDGIRLYNDPATATVAIASMGEGVGIAAGLGEAGLLGTVGTSMVGAGALAEGAALGAGLYGSGIGSLGTQVFGAPAITAATPTATGIASSFSAPNYLAQLSNVAPATEAAASPFQVATNEAITKAISTPATSALNPVTAMQAPVNAVPELSNASNVFTAAQQPVSSSGIQSLAQGRGFAPVESIATTPTVTAPVVEAPVIQSPVESSLLNPSNTTPADFKLATPASSPTSYDALSNIDKATSSRIAEANKAMQGRGMTGSAWQDFKTLASKPNWANIKEYASEHPYATAAGAYGLYKMMQPKQNKQEDIPQYVRPYKSTRAINANVNPYQPYSNASTSERNWLTGGLEALPIYRAAQGGLTSLGIGGPVEAMSAENAVGENFSYPQAALDTPMYSNPMVQRPMATNVINQGLDANVDPYSGEQRFADGGTTGEAGGYKYSYDPVSMQFTQLSEPTPQYDGVLAGTLYDPMGNNQWMGGRSTPAPKKEFTPIVTGGIAPSSVQSNQQPTLAPAQPQSNVSPYQTPEQQLGLDGFYDYMNQQLAGMRGQQGMATGGLSTLGGYSDGGRLLKGPGDGVSDSIPASIGDRQPARLADGEFVVPARIVSEIGNGSTEAGARKLYAMMDRVQKARKKSLGKERVAVNSRADKYLPA